jgi:plasmid stabilization system protein ParE
MMPVDLLPGARRDFDDSLDWYTARSTVAAEQFSSAIDATLATIAADPTRFAAVDAIHRDCLVPRFPYRIIYRIEPTQILVVAIAHAKRRPGFWKARG